MNEPTCKRCTKCGETKPLTEFSRDRARPDGRVTQCKTCRRDYSRQRYAANREAERERIRRYHAANREAERERARQYREANPEKVRENLRRYREANREIYLKNHRETMRRRRAADPEKAREYMHAYNRQYRKVNRERLDERARQYREAARDAVFGHYSPASPPCCACCGTTSNLSIDHIGGDGADHREEVNGKSRGGTLWYWLIKQEFPPGFQVLCKPCNASKGRGEHCILDH